MWTNKRQKMNIWKICLNLTIPLSVVVWPLQCGVPKKGHVCPYQPKVTRKVGEPLPEMRSAAIQVEMDEVSERRYDTWRIRVFLKHFGKRIFCTDFLTLCVYISYYYKVYDTAAVEFKNSRIPRIICKWTAWRRHGGRWASPTSVHEYNVTPATTAATTWGYAECCRQPLDSFASFVSPWSSYKRLSRRSHYWSGLMMLLSKLEGNHAGRVICTGNCKTFLLPERFGVLLARTKLFHIRLLSSIILQLPGWSIWTNSTQLKSSLEKQTIQYYIAYHERTNYPHSLYNISRII